jgi:hypothetical protein
MYVDNGETRGVAMDHLQAIRVFCRVVETGAFNRAAQSLHMPNATVSKWIRSLETHLGVALLERSTRRVHVTNEGSAYYERMCAYCWPSWTTSNPPWVAPMPIREVVYVWIPAARQQAAFSPQPCQSSGNATRTSTWRSE